MEKKKINFLETIITVSKSKKEDGNEMEQLKNITNAFHHFMLLKCKEWLNCQELYFKGYFYLNEEYIKKLRI